MAGRPRKGFGNRERQRALEGRRIKVSVGLYCHLHNLMGDILNGDASKLGEFQEFLNYAPQSTRESLSRRLSGGEDVPVVCEEEE